MPDAFTAFRYAFFIFGSRFRFASYHVITLVLMTPPSFLLRSLKTLFPPIIDAPRLFSSTARVSEGRVMSTIIRASSFRRRQSSIATPATPDTAPRRHAA